MLVHVTKTISHFCTILNGLKTAAWWLKHVAWYNNYCLANKTRVFGNVNNFLHQAYCTAVCFLQTWLPPCSYDQMICFCCRGFESETDTEEFEKVGQSPVEMAFDTKPSTGNVCISGQVTEQVQEPDTVPSVLGMLEVGVCGSRADSSTPPSSSPLLPHQQPSLLLQSHSEFTTADFYIDESMPSSYTESNSARCHHQTAPELIRQLEDTNTLVTLLQVQNTGADCSCADKKAVFSFSIFFSCFWWFGKLGLVNFVHLFRLTLDWYTLAR